jgi:hypothetical protein
VTKIKHPVTGLPFDYEHTCNTCVNFTDKTRTVNKVKFRTTKCALDPEQRDLANIKGTAWQSLPACSKHKHN